MEAYNHPDVISPGVPLARDAGVAPATDDWPFLYMRDRHIPSHYLWALALVLVVSIVAVRGVLWGTAVAFSWHFFFLGAGFMLLETKSIIQFALLWGSTWVVASLAILSVLVMAMAATWVVSRIEVTRPWLVGGVLLALLAASYALPVGRLAFSSLGLESAVYAAPDVQPDPLRRPAVRLQPQADARHPGRLRRQPARRDGRRRGRVPVPGDGLPDAADRGRRLLPGGPGRPPAVLMYPCAASAKLNSRRASVPPGRPGGLRDTRIRRTMNRSCQQPKQSRPNAKRLLWAGFLAILAAGIGFGIRGGILANWAADFGFTGAQLGAIGGAGFTGFCFGIIIGGVVVDRIGYGKLVVAAFLFHVLSAFITFARDEGTSAGHGVSVPVSGHVRLRAGERHAGGRGEPPRLDAVPATTGPTT